MTEPVLDMYAMLTSEEDRELRMNKQVRYESMQRIDQRPRRREAICLHIQTTADPSPSQAFEAWCQLERLSFD